MEMETAVRRRSRTCRQSTGKRIALTSRDLEIFRLLGRYRYLRSTFIHAFVGGDRTKLIERLGHLYHEGEYINRPAQQWQAVNARYQPAIYELDAKGEAQLAESGLAVEAATWLGRDRTTRQHQFAHALMICDVLASIELGAHANPSLRFITWQEILAHPRCPHGNHGARQPIEFRLGIETDSAGRGLSANTIVPDAVFGIEYTGDGRKTYRFCAVEADRATMPVTRTDPRQSSFRNKLLAYRDIIGQQAYRAQFGMPNLFVLTITMGAARMKSIMQSTAELVDDTRFYLFKARENPPSEGAPAATSRMITEPWSRVDHPALSLDLP